MVITNHVTKQLNKAVKKTVKVEKGLSEQDKKKIEKGFNNLFNIIQTKLSNERRNRRLALLQYILFLVFVIMLIISPMSGGTVVTNLIIFVIYVSSDYGLFLLKK